LLFRSWFKRDDLSAVVGARQSAAFAELSNRLPTRAGALPPIAGGNSNALPR
jgi:hypothetical protein